MPAYWGELLNQRDLLRLGLLEYSKLYLPLGLMEEAKKLPLRGAIASTMNLVLHNNSLL